MSVFLSKKIMIVGLALLCIAGLSYWLFPSGAAVDFNAEVKPIFNKKCISCHGGVKKKGGFSVLFREEALANTESGKPAIIPGRPGKSELIRRITTTDAEERMPYKHEPLSNKEISILKRWVKQGAQWGTHWAYVPVKQQKLPDAALSQIKNDIDLFVYEKMQKEALSFSPEADKATLLRRASLDLTGLPADSTLAYRFIGDTSEKAYENLLDSLLASPAYGERWTSLWLDLARYADTKGYEADQGRTIWRYRDWLINAFNNDKPYTEFLVEQLAGDLLPDPDDLQYIATAFHRNSLTNDEGGTDNEEFRTAAVMDRVNTTWTALLGTTFNCVQCHSHPYDPFKQEEYYQFMAFFNNTRDEDTEPDYPLLRQFSGKDSLNFIALKEWLEKNASPEEAKAEIQFLKTWQPAINSLQCDQFVNAANTGWVAEIRNYGSCRLKNVPLNNSTQLMFRFVTIHNGGQLQIFLDTITGQPYTSIPLNATQTGWEMVTVSLKPVAGNHTLYFKYVNPSIPASHVNGLVLEWFRFSQSFPGKGKPGYESMKALYASLVSASAVTTPVMMENNPAYFRPTYFFERGNWLIKGPQVEAGVPAVLNPFPADAPKNRLGLALWLTDKQNPLTARTFVNRVWEQLFGAGLAETLEDLGTQGLPPTHRALLDHLSWQFMHDHKWSIKKLLKQIMMSATYRQSSKVNEELLKKDPANKLFARGPRVRLGAEQLRDQSLAVSSLLSKKMYGPPVMPFQPDGIWRSPYNGAVWKMSIGEDQYRRALYTYWKRTAPYPSMITFDGVSREVCSPRRIRTNTPLQALTTLNDSAYLLMARHFALRLQQDAGTPELQIQKGYERMLYKPVSPERKEALLDLYNQSLAVYKKDKEAAGKLTGLNNEGSKAETAALVVVANAMLNMDEWINKN